VAYRFTDSWTDEIFNETSKPEYQTALIRLVDPSQIQRDYDEDTATWTIVGDGILYTGQARVKPIRWGNFTGGESQANSSSISAIRVQIPEYAGRVDKGVRVLVLDADNASIEGRIFTISSDLQGSSIATRTFEAAADQDAVMPEETP
jgi:hypothetical protein